MQIGDGEEKIPLTDSDQLGKVSSCKFDQKKSRKWPISNLIVHAAVEVQVAALDSQLITIWYITTVFFLFFVFFKLSLWTLSPTLIKSKVCLPITPSTEALGIL